MLYYYYYYVYNHATTCYLPHRFWYSWEGQDISIGDYWNDPHHQEAFSDPKTDVLLARLNNQTGHNKSHGGFD